MKKLILILFLFGCSDPFQMQYPKAPYGTPDLTQLDSITGHPGISYIYTCLNNKYTRVSYFNNHGNWDYVIYTTKCK